MAIFLVTLDERNGELESLTHILVEAQDQADARGAANSILTDWRGAGELEEDWQTGEIDLDGGYYYVGGEEHVAVGDVSGPISTLDDLVRAMGHVWHGTKCQTDGCTKWAILCDEMAEVYGCADHMPDRSV